MLSIYLAAIDAPEEKSKFKKLYQLYEQDMFKTAYEILKSDFDSEDAVHMAFTNIIKHMEKITETDSPRTRGYLLITVRHTALKVLEMRNKIVRTGNTPAERLDDFDLEEYVISGIEAERLAAVLKTLPLEHYEILFLEIYMDMSITEISEVLGITYEAAKKRLQRAKKKFGEMAKEEFENAE